MITDPKLINYHQTITALHKTWVPHTGQIRVGKALFYDRLKSIFIQCGRKWGKTELILYILWRWAQLFPGSRCYYVAPLLNQAKEIVWADPRIVNFGPRSWLLEGSRGVNNTEMRLNFKNGSFIKLDGSDNYEKHRGTRPSLMVYEEFKDHRPEFRNVMRPNLSVCDAPEVFLGTPPEMEGEFTQTAEEHQKDPAKFYYEAASYDNPHIPRHWLDTERKRLYDKGEGDVWEREYMGKYVPGGVSKIFPMLSKKQHMRPHDEVMRMIWKDRKKLEWYVVADPAASSVFGVLFGALNPYTKRWFWLDELYETRQQEMSVKRIGRSLILKRNALWQWEWDHVYDEAETWFANEWMDGFPNEPTFHPTHKALNDKDVGVSLIKDCMLAEKWLMSERCAMFFHELDSYFRDKNGKIPKGKDHLIDCSRYGFGAANYSLASVHEERKEDDEDFRGAKISDDFAGMNDNGDPQEYDDMDVRGLWKS